jgi:hypothetical protein
MTSEDTNAQLLDENPNAPICKGCNCVLVGNEHMWKRDGSDIYCCATCYHAARKDGGK